MPVLASSIDPKSSEFRENKARMKDLVEDLNKTVAGVLVGGGSVARQKHQDRGKLLPRERIRLLTDPGSPFLELSQLAAKGVYKDDVPAAGLITGIGRVHGMEVMVVANDATVKGGTYYPLTVKNTSELRKSLNRITSHVSISSTRVAPFCPCRTKCFPMRSILVGFFITKPIYPLNESPKLPS